MQYNSEFWNALDKLVTNSEIVIYIIIPLTFPIL